MGKEATICKKIKGKGLGHICNIIFSRDEFCSLDFPIVDLIAPESKAKVLWAFEKHQNSEEVEPYEYNLIAKDGQKLNAIVTTKLIQYEGDRAIL